MNDTKHEDRVRAADVGRWRATVAVRHLDAALIELDKQGRKSAQAWKYAHIVRQHLLQVREELNLTIAQCAKAGS